MYGRCRTSLRYVISVCELGLLVWNKRDALGDGKMLKVDVLWGFVEQCRGREGSTGDLVEVECNGIAMLKMLECLRKRNSLAYKWCHGRCLKV